MNYAKTQPELVILAVNTFVKDSEDHNPLVIRTMMGCLRAEKTIDYLCDPLQRALGDENPCIRKKAALCTAKLYDLKPEFVIDNGFLEWLHELVLDSNPMNTVVALTDIRTVVDSCSANY
ncbi:Clathrin/coatomer adaptor, adaptin-like protein [Chiua virens]|nr:Clathrin/coatomer adaptor, adaptin-like protein [Chiua virens]